MLLSTLTYSQGSEKDVLKIVQQVIDNAAINNPEHVLENFTFQKYTKGVFKSLEKKILEPISKESDYLFEEASSYTFNQKQQYQKTVIAAQIPGFKTPFYPLFTENYHSLFLTNKEFTLFEQNFYNPLSKKGLKKYQFQLVGVVTKTNRPYYIVHFSPANRLTSTQLNGFYYVDCSSYAIQKAAFNYRQNSSIKVVYDFEYIKDYNLWFPSKITSETSILNGKNAYYLFGKTIPVASLKYQKNNLNLLILETYFSDLNKTIKQPLKPQISVLTNLKSLEKDSLFWKRLRQKRMLSKNTQELQKGQDQSGLTFTENNIIRQAQNRIQEKGYEKQIERIADFEKGFLELGFFDLDLKYLLKFNNFEGFRTGLGGVTNEKLFNNLSVGGYLVRGFKDDEWKFQAQTKYTFSQKKGLFLSLGYTDDVAELGTNQFLTDQRSFSFFEPRLINIIQFYKHNSWQLNLGQQIIPSLQAEVQLSKSEISQTLDYQFTNNNSAFTNYNITQAKASVSWSPFGMFFENPFEIREYRNGFPRFSAQLTQSIKGLLNSDFNFTKIDVRLDHRVKHLNQSTTEIVLEGNLGFGDIPLTHLYHAYPNSPNKETVLRRFSVAGIKSFETMYFGEFFSDKLAALHLKHQLKPFLVTSWLKPELVFISRHALGTITNIENHQNISFKKLNKGYSESGFEINKLLWGFGASFAYRYGAYHLPDFEDNISFKFTFNLKL